MKTLDEIPETAKLAREPDIRPGDRMVVVASDGAVVDVGDGPRLFIADE